MERGLVAQFAGPDGDVVGGRAVAVESGQAEDLIADGDVCDAVGDLGDRAGHLVRGDDRRPVAAFPGGPAQVPGQLGEGDRGGVHGDKGFARPGRRYRGLLVDELFGSAAGMRAQRHHRVHQGTSRYGFGR
jgi:hypothetical protein